MRSLSIPILCVVGVLQVCLGQPANDTKVGNLKFTFDSADDIPAAFYSNPAKKSPEVDQRKVFPPCQDGSGGICVEQGQCSPELKSSASPATACGSGLECCFGPAQNDKSCASRGGECMSPASACGRQPTFKEANDCDTLKGEVCCILI